MLTKPILIKVPAQPKATLAEIAKTLYSCSDTRFGVATSFEESTKRWEEDHLVWLWPANSEAKFDCTHSIYGEFAKLSGTFTKMIGVHGLFCLAAHLRDNECTELKEVEVVLHAFGDVHFGQKQILNHDQGIAFDVPDLWSTALFINNGRPGGLMNVEHSGHVDDDFLVGFAGKVSLFDFEEEKVRLEAIPA